MHTQHNICLPSIAGDFDLMECILFSSRKGSAVIACHTAAASLCIYTLSPLPVLDSHHIIEQLLKNEDRLAFLRSSSKCLFRLMMDARIALSKTFLTPSPVRAEHS